MTATDFKDERTVFFYKINYSRHANLQSLDGENEL